jgi:hypothetical protein
MAASEVLSVGAVEVPFPNHLADFRASQAHSAQTVIFFPQLKSPSPLIEDIITGKVTALFLKPSSALWPCQH